MYISLHHFWFLSDLQWHVQAVFHILWPPVAGAVGAHGQARLEAIVASLRRPTAAAGRRAPAARRAAEGVGHNSDLKQGWEDEEQQLGAT